MLAAELALFCLVTLMFFIVGGVVGWLTKSHLYENSIRQVYTHPEMFDENGNIIPDEILAVRFENDFECDYDEEEDD